MNTKVIYTFTYERLQEFKNKKTGKCEVIPSMVYIEKEKTEEWDPSIEYFIDISNIYKANIENSNVIIENILYKSFESTNLYIILAEHLKTRFRQDFATSFDGFKAIQTIYEEDTKYKTDFTNLDSETVGLLEQSLNKSLIGHERFKEDFLEKIKFFPVLYKIGEMKIFSILLCGNPGVGKTEVARILHNTLYEESKIIKINLGNYKTDGALNSLIGSPLGFIGSERGGELSNKIRNSDSKIILIDELEKANTDIFNFFYELLEDGKFTDLTGNEYKLDGYVIIFTTNLSKDNYKNVLPAPLVSRFTLKYYFENPTEAEKIEFIEKRISDLLNKYDTEIGDQKISKLEINKNINYDKINNIFDFRIINREITNAFTKTIEEINSSE